MATPSSAQIQQYLNAHPGQSGRQAISAINAGWKPATQQTSPLASTPAPDYPAPVESSNQGAPTSNVALPTKLNNFSNVNEQGLPILDQKALDSVLAKYKGNSLTSCQYRDNYNKFGWNAKSDSSYVRHGPAILGLDMGTVREGMSGGSPGFVKAGTSVAASDADFKKAAGQLGLDYNSYIKPKAFVATNNGMGGTETPNARNSRQYTDPVTGETYLARIDGKGNFQTTLDQKALFGDINNQTKDLYVVGNILEAKGANKQSPHAAITFRADGSGNLVPITKEDGTIAYQPYNGVSVVHKGASGQFADLAPLALFAAAVAAPYLLGTVGGSTGALTAGQVGAAGAGAGAGAGIGTLGLGAGAGLGTGTMAGTMLGATGATLGSTAALGAGSLAALNGATGALSSGAGTLPSSTGGLPGVEAGNVMAGYTGTPLNSLGTEAGLGGAGYAGADTLANIEQAAIADTFNPNAPGYEVGLEGPAKIGSQCVGFKESTSLLDTAKKVKDLYKSGKDLFGSCQPAACGTNCGAPSGFPGFLCGTAEFLNKPRPSGKSAGLKTVNKEAEQNVGALDFDDSQSAPTGYADAGAVTKERNNQGYLSDAIKEWDAIFCQDKLTPKFVKCDLPEFLFSKKSLESHKLKPLKQGLRVNPLATGGLPHKYAAAAPKGHKPEFITGMTGYYACGGGTGQSDDIPAMLHDGDYVMDAETVSALGDGSSKAGRNVLEGFREQIPHKKEGGSNPVPAKIADGEYVFPEAFVTALGGGDNKRGAEILDGLRTKLRAHKRGAPLDKIPPKAKDPLEYIKTGSKQHG